MNNNNFVQVAKLGKTIGLKGYVKLHNLSDFPKQFKKGMSYFCLELKKELIIKHYNSSNSTILFENHENLNDAKQLTNCSLYQSIEKSREICKLKKDEFFYFDILKCEVFDPFQKLGKVINIVETGTSYLLEIQTDEILTSKNYTKTFFIPYLDKFVSKIDIEKYHIFCTEDAFLILENS